MNKNMITSIALSILLAFSGCSEDKNIDEETKPTIETTQEIQGSFESKYKRYVQHEKPEDQSTASGVTTQWSDTVWRNERVHTQIVLWSEKDVENITFQVRDLKNGDKVIPSSNIRLRFPSYVLGDTQALDCDKHTTRQSAYIADALSEEPVNKILLTDLTKIWVTIDIPKDSNPGLYQGSIDIIQAGKTKLSFEVKLLVTNHTLPDVKNWSYHLDIWQFPFQLSNLCSKNGTKIEPFSPKYETLMSSFYKILADAGQTAITTYIKDGAFQNGETMINWSLNRDNTWHFDYTNFDKFVEFMSSLGINKQINCFSLVGWNNSIGYYDVATSNYTSKKLEIGTDEYNEVWTAFLQSFRTHLKTKGWFDKSVLFLDEAPDNETRAVIELIRKDGVDWKIGLAGSRIAADLENELYDYSVLLGYKKASNNPVSTFYTSCSHIIPNNYLTPQNNPAEMVWMSWYAASQGLNGYLRWAFDYWLSSNPQNMQDGSNTAGDFCMIYRTDNTASSKAISSIRFELLREGIQDYEKIKILSNSELKSYLNQIDETSGINSQKLIEGGQKLLKQISARK